jgi:hypothetical protein
LLHWLNVILVNGFAQDTVPTKKYIAYDGLEIRYTPQELALKLPADLKPILDYPIRDVSICLGPDSTYYMTGTTGAPDMWAVTSEIKIWKSKDLRTWTTVITKPRPRSSVWNVDREGAAWSKKSPSGTVRHFDRYGHQRSIFSMERFG